MSATTYLDQLWLRSRDGDPIAFAMFTRHYSYRPYADGRRERPNYGNRMLFVGPGEKLVLMTLDRQALFVWRRFIAADKQEGVCCAVFRNEGAYGGVVRSSLLILAAEAWAWSRWPGQRLYTYVNPRAVRSTNPGCCYRAAGWRPCGVTQARKLLILEKVGG